MHTASISWTSALGLAPYRDCTGRVTVSGKVYWFEVVSFQNGVDVSLWALSKSHGSRRSRDIKIGRDRCQNLRRFIEAAYKARIEEGLSVDVTSYLRTCASNCGEAHALLHRMGER